MSDDDLIRRGDALAAVRETPGRFAGCTEENVRSMVAGWLTAIPATDAREANPWVVALTFTVQRGNIDQIERAA